MKPVIRSREFSRFEAPQNTSSERWNIEHMPTAGLIQFEKDMDGWLENVKNGKMPPDAAKYNARILFQVARELDSRGQLNA